MAQTGFTPIKIYSSSTATNVPLAANLAQGELAINTADGKLFYKDSSNVVQVIATKAGANGTVTSVSMTVPSFLSIAGSPITSSGTLSVTLSGTALPVANGGTGITSFGTGVATWLGTPTSANLASAVTDETGTGSLVFATSPTLVTPVLGTPTSGNFSTGTFTWPTFNQNTNGTAAGLSTTLVVGSGGTGLTTLSTGSILYGAGTSAFSALAIGTAGQFLTVNSGATAPQWTTLLPVANGGTGTATPALVAGTNISISGSWPNQTINSTGGSSTFAAGVGMSVTNVSGTVTYSNTQTPATITTATTITPTITTSQYNVTNLASAATIAAPSAGVDGQRLLIRIRDNGTARALTWTTSAGGYRALSVVLPTTTVANTPKYIGCIYNSQNSFWDVVAVA